MYNKTCYITRLCIFELIVNETAALRGSEKSAPSDAAMAEGLVAGEALKRLARDYGGDFPWVGAPYRLQVHHGVKPLQWLKLASEALESAVLCCFRVDSAKQQVFFMCFGLRVLPFAARFIVYSMGLSSSKIAFAAQEPPNSEVGRAGNRSRVLLTARNKLELVRQRLFKLFIGRN